MHVSAVFSKQNFPNQNTRKTIAGILYVYVIVVVCWGNGKPWTTTAAYLLYYQVLTLSSRLAPAQRTQDDTHYQVYFTWSRVLILLLVYYLLLLKKCPKSKVKKHSFAINYTFIHRISHSSEWFQAPEYICLVVTPTVLVVRPTFSVARDHSPSDEQPDPTETAGQGATARLVYLVWTDVGFAA